MKGSLVVKIVMIMSKARVFNFNLSLLEKPVPLLCSFIYRLPVSKLVKDVPA